MEISYRHTERVESQTLFGRVLRWMGAHPIAAGFVAGVAVVAIATARVPGVFFESPLEAATLSVLVVGVWTLLFFFMRSFFERQGYVDRETTRRFTWEDETFLWEEEGTVLLEVSEPTVELRRPPGTEQMEPTSEDQAHRIWIVVDGKKVSGDERLPLRIETKITAGEAQRYEVAEVPEGGAADEVLSVGEVQSLLGEVERAVAPQRAQ